MPSGTFDARRRSSYEEMKRKEHEAHEAHEAKRVRPNSAAKMPGTAVAPLVAPSLMDMALPGTVIDDQCQDDALELLDLMSPVNDPQPAHQGASATDKGVANTTSTCSAGCTTEDEGEGANAAASLRGASSTGALNESSSRGFNPVDLLKVLDALAPPSVTAAVSASGATFEMPSRVSATELQAVLDLLGAPPNPNPMLEQMILHKEEEVAALLVCQPCQPTKEVAAPSNPAAVSESAKPANEAEKSRSGDRQTGSLLQGAKEDSAASLVCQPVREVAASSEPTAALEPAAPAKVAGRSRSDDHQTDSVLVDWDAPD